MSLLNPQRHVVPTEVLTKSKLVPLTAARQVTTAVPQPYVTRPRPSKTVVIKSPSPPRRNINRRPSPKPSNFPPKVTTVKVPQGNPHHALKDKGVTDSGCSRRMTGNMSYLSNFKEINGGYVAFGGNPKGDPLGKFDGNDDEEFFIGYSTMNYQPVTAGNQSNPSVGVQEQFDAEKAGEDNVQQYVLFPLWSFSSKIPQNIDDDDAFEVKETDFKGRKPESEVYVSPSSSALTKKHDDKTKRKAKGKSLVELSTGYINLSAEFEDFFDNSINEVNAAGTSVPAVGQLSTDSTNTFSAASPSNTVVSPTLEKSLYVDTSQYPDDPNMPELENITYSDDEEDVGVEVDFTNFETTITVNPIPTTRVHKYHLVTQIIGNLSSATQTMSMTRVAKDQGLQVKQKLDGIFIIHDKYVAKILRTFGLTDGKSASTPIDTEKPLLKDPNGDDVDVHTYRLMIGSLMYLTSSRPDVMFAVYACARFYVIPKVSHLHAFKMIFRYLKGKPYLGLWYPKDSPFNLVAYLDSDYAGASLDRKSTTGGFQFLGCRLISWQCKKQTVVTALSTEAEYVAVASYCTQVLWIQNQLLDYGHDKLQILVADYFSSWSFVFAILGQMTYLVVDSTPDCARSSSAIVVVCVSRAAAILSVTSFLMAA
nr:hypothetical protein [Tanacetum cinerariifolium]